ncbi:MAG TPA: transposase family protein [Ktedonobacterales bacterium]|nr:transposase family protein [Ktedonobacterales bacterium]
MRNILNLPEWTVIKTEEEPRAYHIHARFDIPSSACRSCLRFGYLRRYGVREQVYLDLPMHGRRVAIHVHRQRYQ